MDQSNSSNSKPSKPLKVKGRFSPKNQATSASATGQPLQQPEYAQSQATPSFQGEPSAYGQPPYTDQQPPYYGASPVEPPNGKLKHGGLGIASFIMSILSMLTIVIGFVLIFASIFDMSESDLLMLQDPAQIESMILSSETMPSFIVSVVIGGLLMIGSAVVAFIGFILGVISLFIKQRRKVFGILGTIFNGLLCFGGFIFMLLSFLSAFSV